MGEYADDAIDHLIEMSLHVGDDFYIGEEDLISGQVIRVPYSHKLREIEEAFAPFVKHRKDNP